MNHPRQSLDRAQADLQALRSAITDQRQAFEALLARHRLDPEALYRAYQRASPEQQRLIDEQLSRVLQAPRSLST